MATPNPVPTDGYPTLTSKMQADTEAVLRKHIPPSNTEGLVLEKNSHIQFLIRNLVQGFPPRYISQDASQPWLLFWTIQSFSTLQVVLDPGNKQRCRICASFDDMEAKPAFLKSDRQSYDVATS